MRVDGYHLARATDLRRRLGELLEIVEGGGSILLLRRGRPVARLVPVEDQDTAGAPAPRWKRPVAARTLRGPSIVETLRGDRDGG